MKLGRWGQRATCGVVIVVALLAPDRDTGAVPMGPSADRLFHEGRFIEAATVARLQADARSLALAARALNTHATFEARGPAHRRAGYTRALTDAREALTLNPGDVEAHLQASVALGNLVALEGPYAETSPALAREGHGHIRQALDLDPENAWAHAMMGAWHLTVVHYAGPVIAELLFGANRPRGHEHFATAERLDPLNAVIRFQRAQALLLDREDPKAARDALGATLGLSGAGALDRIIRDEAVTLLASLG